MGMFSYSCTKCGGKDQFDWMNGCVVKIGGFYVRATYDGYGRAKIAVTGGKEGTTVNAYPEQFRMNFDYWNLSDGDLYATDIYCDGDGKADGMDAKKAQMAMLEQLMSGGKGSFSDEEDEVPARSCTPKGVTVLDALDASLLDSLPKAKSVSASESDKNTGTKKKPSSSPDNGTNTKGGTRKVKKAKSAKF